ncbi:MAG TPA: FHA domain-containing protein [Ignavibacteriaceae bacterium]
MKIKFNITKKSEPSFSSVLDFNRFPVSLGRDEKNDVILPDPFKVVSRKHAKILNTEGILQLVDLESANFTYLNEEAVIPNEENALKTGDTIRIGEYELKVELVKEQEYSEEDDQKTMVFSSPFAEEVNSIVESLNKISEKFAGDDSPMKLEMLKFSVMQSFNFLEKNQSNKYLAEYFAEHFLDKKIQVQSPKPQVHIEPKKTTEPAPIQTYSLSSHFTETIDVLLDTFTKLIQGFLQFRQEFFGVTIYHTIPTGSLKEFKEFLFSPDISQEDERKRLGLLKEETSKLLSHQIGLLEGYQLSVTDGSKALLETLDPAVIEREMDNKAKQSGPDIGKIIPFAKKSKVLDALKENYHMYLSDPYHIEKKFFRPSFMKGYQKRIISGKSQNEY